MKNTITVCLMFITLNTLFYAQNIPLGYSYDSVPIFEANIPITSISLNQAFYYYKPTSYNVQTSGIAFIIHGSGGNGLDAVADFEEIAERRGILMIGLTMEGGSSIETGATMRFQEGVTVFYDTLYYNFCMNFYSGTVVLKQVYQHILERENRTEIPSYLFGFSAGGQFVTRYVLQRQAFKDSIPLKMAVSSNPYYYTFPTDTFNGVHMPYMCGIDFENSDYNSSVNTIACPLAKKIYHFNCPEHVRQYYGANYGVLIGTADTEFLGDNECATAQGVNRYERAQTFYNFGQSDAAANGWAFNWKYREVPGVGHDGLAMIHTKANPDDTISICERLLFDTPYVPETDYAPHANFHIGEKIANTVSFVNTSSMATSYLWEFGDTTFSTDVNATHTFTRIGWFHIQLTAINDNACDSWHIERFLINITQEDIIAGLNQETFNSIVSVFPNPNDGFFSIQSDVLNSFKITLRDVTGKNIAFQELNKTAKSCSLEIEKPGIYFLEFSNEIGKFVKKVLVE
jgi:predicted esterase